MTKRVPALKEIKRYVQEAQQLEPMITIDGVRQGRRAQKG